MQYGFSYFILRNRVFQFAGRNEMELIYVLIIDPVRISDKRFA